MTSSWKQKQKVKRLVVLALSEAKFHMLTGFTCAPAVDAGAVNKATYEADNVVSVLEEFGMIRPTIIEITPAKSRRVRR